MNETAYPSIGLDLDGCIDESPIFFQLLARYWPGDVYVITFRRDVKAAEETLRRFKIKYDHIILSPSLEAKADIVRDHGISVFFDDQDEVLQHMSESVLAVKVRNGGNFDYDDCRWLYSSRTGKEI